MLFVIEDDGTMWRIMGSGPKRRAQPVLDLDQRLRRNVIR